MKIHKEGYVTIIIVLLFAAIVNACFFYIVSGLLIFKSLLLVVSVLFVGFIIRFFRFPAIEKTFGQDKIISPADGKVVVIEETTENEYFNDKRLQISIFMSANNVHINWIPVSGTIKYFKYHPGKFLVARLPKSSILNERTSFVIETANNQKILVRQIAGFVARRIVTYPEQGETVDQCNQLGFIKFGSRVDLFLPVGTKINVQLNDKVKGAQTVIANFSN